MLLHHLYKKTRYKKKTKDIYSHHYTTIMKMISGATIVYRFLVEKGIKHVTGYTGGAMLPLLNEFKINNVIKFIKNSNENNSGHFAEGISKSSNTPGVVIATSGPGITNCVTPIYDCAADGVPLIVISGQVNQKYIGTDAFQESPAIEITKPLVKFSKLVTNVRELNDVLSHSYNTAMAHRQGPVHLDIPVDVLMATIPEDEIASQQKTPMKEVFSNETDKMNIEDSQIKYSLELCQDRLNKSNRPIICFGKGSTEISAQATQLVETYKLPFVTTLHGLGVVSERSEYCLGMVGVFGSAAANYAVQNSDLIIGIGNRFDDRTTGVISKYAPHARKSRKGLGIIHVDVSKKQVDKVVDLFRNEDLELNSLNMPSKAFTKYLHDNTHYKDRTEWNSYTTDLQTRYQFDYNKQATDIKVQDVIKSLDQTIDELGIDRGNLYITTGVGNHQMFTAQFITWTHAGKMITSGSAGTMGTGLPFALGTKTANPDSHVICIDGDGSFNMSSNELMTLSEQNVPVKILIMNDSRLQMIHAGQTMWFDRNFIACSNHNPCYQTLAESYGIKSYKCDNHAELATVNRKMMNYNDGPVIVEYVVGPSMCLPWVFPEYGLDEMLFYDPDTYNDM